MTWIRSELTALLAGLVMLLTVVPAHGQGWVVELAAGGTDPRTASAEVGTRNAILGVRRTGPVWLYLSGALPLDSAGLPWAAAGLGGRLETTAGGEISVGADLGAHGHVYRQRLLESGGSGLTLTGLPFAALRHGAARLQVHAGLQSYSSAFQDLTTQRAILDTGVRLDLAPDPRLSVAGQGRWVRAAEGTFPFAGVEVAWADGGVAAWAHAGRWISDHIPTPVWGAGASAEVGRGVGLQLDFQQQAADPLYWNAPRQFWSVGLTRSLGPRGSTSIPVPILPPTSDGQVVIRIPVAEGGAAAPRVAGDFNDWQPVAMVRQGDHWEVRLAVAPGVYHYAFQRTDGSWFVPDSIAGRVDDGFGGVNAVLVVPAS